MHHLLYALALSLITHIAQAKNAPPDGHASMRGGLEVGYQQNLGSFVAPAYRFGLHDFLDPRPGYPENTQLDIFSARLRIYKDATATWSGPSPRLQIDELTAFRVASLAPYLSENERAWKLDAGLKTVREKVCEHCTAGRMLGGLGYAGGWSSASPLSFFLLAEAELSYAPAYQRAAFKPAVGPNAGVRLIGSDHFNALVQATYHYQFFSDFPHVYSGSAELRWAPSLSSSFSARFAYFIDGWESALGAYLYF